MHKHCGLNKWEILDYTLPQIIELMKRVNQYIEFEVSTRGLGMGMFGGAGLATSDQPSYEDGDVATEEDIMELSRVLGGGF